jgi:hypothetical protein
MRNLLFSFILLYTLTACDNNEEKVAHNTKIAQEAKAQNDALLAELKVKDKALKEAREEAKKSKERLLAGEQAKKEAFLREQTRQAQKRKDAKNEKLLKTGIHIENNVITIDTNKTKDFFKNIGKRLEEKLKKITGELEKGMLDEKDTGVQIDASRINIDLNKTKDFLETWGKKMQGFVKEFDNMAKELDTNNKPIQ